MDRHVDQSHPRAIADPGQLMRDRGPEQSGMTGRQSEGLTIHGVFHLTIEWNIHLYLAMPVVTGHLVGSPQFDVERVISRVK